MRSTDPSVTCNLWGMGADMWAHIVLFLVCARTGELSIVPWADSGAASHATAAWLWCSSSSSSPSSFLLLLLPCSWCTHHPPRQLRHIWCCSKDEWLLYLPFVELGTWCICLKTSESSIRSVWRYQIHHHTLLFGFLSFLWWRSRFRLQLMDGCERERESLIRRSPVVVLLKYSFSGLPDPCFEIAHCFVVVPMTTMELVSTFTSWWSTMGSIIKSSSPIHSTQVCVAFCFENAHCFESPWPQWN